VAFVTKRVPTTFVIPAKAGTQRRFVTKRVSATFVIPAKAGIHFDVYGRNMDSRFRGNDGLGAGCMLTRGLGLDDCTIND